MKQSIRQSRQSDCIYYAACKAPGHQPGAKKMPRRHPRGRHEGHVTSDGDGDGDGDGEGALCTIYFVF